jgi:hypothetical protein
MDVVAWLREHGAVTVNLSMGSKLCEAASKGSHIPVSLIVLYNSSFVCWLQAIWNSCESCMQEVQT